MRPDRTGLERVYERIKRTNGIASPMRAMILPGIAGILLIVAMALASAGQRIAALLVLAVFFFFIVLSMMGFRNAARQLLLQMDAEDRARKAAMEERERKKAEARKPRKKEEE